MPAVIMPKMGDAMEEGTLIRWLKQVGDEIAVGDELAEIETDKVSLPLVSEIAGALTKLHVEEGAVVPIGAAIALIGEEAAEAAAPEPEAAPAPAAEA
ncbi:MAG: lipoyl domain-containing protein, partial [Thermomicrobiales bacterium]